MLIVEGDRAQSDPYGLVNYILPWLLYDKRATNGIEYSSNNRNVECSYWPTSLCSISSIILAEAP